MGYGNADNPVKFIVAVKEGDAEQPTIIAVFEEQIIRGKRGVVGEVTEGDVTDGSLGHFIGKVAMLAGRYFSSDWNGVMITKKFV